MRTTRNEAAAERSEPKVSEARWKLWNAVHAYVRHHGGKVTSIPGHREVRIEIQKDSDLPTKLVDLGYQPHHYAAETRIEANQFIQVDIISITLPKG